jgi:VCBS repeat-containing protein
MPQSAAGANIVSNIIEGTLDNGTSVELASTPEGHLEVALHSPRLPFGSINTESLTPIFQCDAVYGVNTGLVEATVNSSGTATASDSNFVTTTGTSVGGFGVIQSRKRLRYRPGQGVIGRCTAAFTSGVASSYQVAGFGHAEDGVYFGYNGTSFGVLYSQRGVREVRTLTVSVASSTNENVTVQLNGTNNTVAVTNSGNIQRTVYELSQGTYSGWKAYPVGATVVFVRSNAGTASGAYGLTASTAVGSFAQTKAGAGASDTWVPQASWNGYDKLDGTGASGVTLDPTKYNVYQFGIQYLGAGVVTFQVEVVPTNGNNADFVTVHTLRLPNTLTTTSFSNPSFPFTMAAYSLGSTTDLTIKCGSFAGFIEGQKRLHGNRFCYVDTSTSVDSGSYHVLFTVQNSRYYQGKTNQAVINIVSLSAALKANQPCTIYLIKNATLVGNPNFSSYATNSCSTSDTAATTCTFSTNDQIVWAGLLGDTGDLDHHFNTLIEELTIQPGESYTVAARTAASTASYVSASLVTREDQ